MAPRSTHEPHVVREWYGQLAVAAKTPVLAQHLVSRMGELLPRFAAYYERLRSLPRRIRRAIGRSRELSLAAIALLLALCGGPLHAATISVDETTCRLADAITSANTDTATGGCPAGSGDDDIVLDADVTLGAPLPKITTDLTIQAGWGSTIDGAGRSCVRVDFATVTLDGIAVQNCDTGADGGGVSNFYGFVTIDHCTISGNTAAGNGGGVYSSGSLTITNSTISGNAAAGNGGGVYQSLNDFATQSISETTISGNTARSGGGFAVSYSFPTIAECTISGNTATSEGGGIAVFYFAALTLRNSTVSGNSGSSGGGIYSYTGFLDLAQSTVSGNSATAAGGGVFCSESYLFLNRNLVSGNSGPAAPELSLHGDLLDSHGLNVVGYDGDSRSEGFTPGPTDIVPASGVLIDDILAPLADNGGPTLTHALVSGSPAVDAIPTNDPSCPGSTDQRGFPRPIGSGCDIGSFELGAGTTFGGSASGFTPRRVTCQDRTTGERLRANPGGTEWDCEGLGLTVQPGDEVQTSARGVAGESGIGGAVTGMTPTAVFCENVSTGAKVQTPTNATEWDCEGLGLEVQPGDRVVTGAMGTAD